MINNAAINGREDKYVCKNINITKALKSWKISLFSFEWLDQEGNIKNRAKLEEREQLKYDVVIDKIKNDEPLERPILGLGLHDNIEIGSKREIFLVLAKKELKTISVHIPLSIEKEFDEYLA